MIDETSDINVSVERYNDDGAGWTNYIRQMIRLRTGKLQGDPPVYVNTCTDMQGTEDRYTAYVNVPGKINMDIDSLRIIYNKDLGDYELSTKFGSQVLDQYLI